MTTVTHAPESKAAGADLSLAFDDLRYTLESYRVSNDERLAQIGSLLPQSLEFPEPLPGDGDRGFLENGTGPGGQPDQG